MVGRSGLGPGPGDVGGPGFTAGGGGVGPFAGGFAMGGLGIGRVALGGGFVTTGLVGGDFGGHPIMGFMGSFG